MLSTVLNLIGFIATLTLRQGCKWFGSMVDQTRHLINLAHVWAEPHWTQTRLEIQVTLETITYFRLEIGHKHSSAERTFSVCVFIKVNINTQVHHTWVFGCRPDWRRPQPDYSPGPKWGPIPGLFWSGFFWDNQAMGVPLKSQESISKWLRLSPYISSSGQQKPELISQLFEFWTNKNNWWWTRSGTGRVSYNIYKPIKADIIWQFVFRSIICCYARTRRSIKRHCTHCTLYLKSKSSKL